MTQLSQYNAETRTGAINSAVNGEELVELRGVSFEEFHRIGQAFRKAERIARERALRLARNAADRALGELGDRP